MGCGYRNSMMCICFPGGALACILGRAHQSHQDVKATFFTHFASIRYEVELVGNQRQRKNRLGRCPFCQKEIVHVNKLNRVSDYVA